MKTKFAFSLLLIPALYLLTLAPAAHSDVWNKKTIVTFSEPVEFPGRVTLPPGTYVMKLLDSPSNRHIVQVFNRRENHIYTTALTIPRERPRPADKTIITFYETPRDTPQFIRTWFYPGDTIGQEFVYSKERREYIASLMNRTTTTTTEVAMNQTTQTVPVVPSEQPEPVVENTEKQVTESTESTSSAASVGALEPPAEEPMPQAAPTTPEPAPAPAESLPKTASPLPTIGGLGLLLIAAGGLLRRVNA